MGGAPEGKEKPNKKVFHQISSESEAKASPLRVFFVKLKKEVVFHRPGSKAVGDWS